MRPTGKLVDPKTLIPLDQDIYVAGTLEFKWLITGVPEFHRVYFELPTMSKEIAARELVKVALALCPEVFAEDEHHPLEW